MQTELVIALAASAFSLLATVLSVIANGRIARRNDEAAARRSYEYEALKRLYTEVEPLLFQVESAAAGARDRALNLARAARMGALSGPKHWLDKEDYYLVSTAYALAKPAAYYRLLERRITSIDLGLDPRKAIVFALLREYDRALGADFELAGHAPALPYAPNDDSEIPIESDVRFRQGLVAGRRENLVDALIVRDPGEAARVRGFGELETALESEEATRRRFAPLFLILRRFSPAERPVFWRIVLLQATLARLIIELLEPRPRLPHLRRTLNAILDDGKFREAHATREDGESHDPEAYEAVRAYLGPKLGAIARRHALQPRNR